MERAHSQPRPPAPHGEGAVTRQFAPAAASVAEARRFVLEQVPDQDSQTADELVLMVSELATNAVQHSGTGFEVAVAVEAYTGLVRVDVTDAGSGYPAPPEPADDAPHGRGLHIVRALADSWGIEVHRDRPGKTVWFSLRLPPRLPPEERPRRLPGGTDELTAPATGARWPVRGVRAVLDNLRDGVVATDQHGVILYANVAAEALLGWPSGSLTGRSALELVPDYLAAPLEGDFAGFLRNEAAGLAGQKLAAVIKRADGSDVDTELVISVVEHPQAGWTVVGIFRARDDATLQRWSELTTELLEILAGAPIADPPAERLLSTLGRRLGWDVTTLWALSAKGDLVCRHVWTRSPDIAPAFAHEKAADPTSGSEGLPRWVVEQNEPLWVRDLTEDARFLTDTLQRDGLTSAYAFPIRYRGTCVGIVKMLSRERRERDPTVVELMEAVSGHLGELLHASAQAAEREHLLDELLEARRRNEFLLLATHVLSEVVDYREMVERLAQVSVPVMADLCLIDIVDEDGQMRRMAAWHADPAKRDLAERLRTTYPPDPAGAHPTVSVVRSGKSMWSSSMSDEFLRETSRDEGHYSILKALGFTSYMTVPLRLRDQQVIGTVTLVSAGSGRRFSEKDLGLAEQLAKQVSSVVIRARAYERERRISHELQRNMLPDAIPTIDGWNVAARYLPAALGVEVGGDWYDVVPIGDHLVALVVGDVEGHDLEAAKVMSRFRHTLGLLLLEEMAPGKALERLNHISLAQRGSRLSTALVGVLEMRTGAITFASAGHHSPVRIRQGEAWELPVPPGPPLGVHECQYKDHEFNLDTGCLLMFTDGLVERRGTPLDDRLTQLESSLRTAPSFEPDGVADFVLEAMTSDERSADDVVVLTACRQVGGAPGDCPGDCPGG
jgi:PAS domain S-box-containing protein